MRARLRVAGACLLAAAGGAQAVQIPPDRSDPALITRSLPIPASPPPATVAPTQTPRPAGARVGIAVTVAPRAIRVVDVDGADVPTGDYAGATAPYLGHALSPADLGRLAGAVAGVARARGLVLATASIRPQPLDDGTLVVTLDEGRIDAVRSLGSPNAAADRILSRLVTHRAITRHELESTLLLVGDLPGARVVNTRYARENGFGILLVTLAVDRASLFAQADNRGTDEIGPWRTTEVASLHGVLGDGDEVGIVASQTPANPREFEFVSGRYALPVGRSGGVASASAFFGATHAGGDLRALDLTGRTYGGAIGYTAVLHRTKTASLWLDLNLQALENSQKLRGRLFRDDVLTLLSGTVRTSATVAGGSFRGGLTISGGLPVPGVTHEGDPLASRGDGDARFVTVALQGEWKRPLAGPLAIQLAGVGQAASRPLLATAEISLGGPSFGRAYDYSERTGDQGVLGSAELQMDLDKLGGSPLPRLQLYAFVDGGVVDNLRRGIGGGSLASAGGGMRVGSGRLDGALEVAAPLDAPRFDTGDKSPRVSIRLSTYL